MRTLGQPACPDLRLAWYLRETLHVLTPALQGYDRKHAVVTATRRNDRIIKDSPEHAAPDIRKV